MPSLSPLSSCQALFVAQKGRGGCEEIVALGGRGEQGLEQSLDSAGL